MHSGAPLQECIEDQRAPVPVRVLQLFGRSVILMASSSPHEPLGIDIDANRGPAFIYLCSAMIVLSTVVIALRLWSRKLLKIQFTWSDRLSLIALVSPL